MAFFVVGDGTTDVAVSVSDDESADLIAGLFDTDDLQLRSNTNVTSGAVEVFFPGFARAVLTGDDLDPPLALLDQDQPVAFWLLDDVTPIEAAASGTIEVSGSATGTSTVQAAAAGSIGVTGSATGTSTVQAAAVGTVGMTGVVTGGPGGVIASVAASIGVTGSIRVNSGAPNNSSRYYVFDGTAGTPSARTILRWGDCPASQVALQAINAGEVVVADAYEAPFDDGFEVVYNETTRAFSLSGLVLATVIKANRVRKDRTNRLEQCDWLFTVDVHAALTATQRTNWATYRANLRAVPQQSGFPWTITWPTQPADPTPIP